MAISAGCCWEVRTTGSNQNGGGFVKNSYGVDRSLQDYPHVSFDGNNIKLTSTGVTSIATLVGYTGSNEDVGNIVQILGGTNATPGFYQIISATSSSWTLDRTWCTGAVNDGYGNMGGALAHPSYILSRSTTLEITSRYSVWVKSGIYEFSSDFTISPGSVYIIGYGTTRGDMGGASGRPIFRMVGNATRILYRGDGTFFRVSNIIFEDGKEQKSGYLCYTGNNQFSYWINCDFRDCEKCVYGSSNYFAYCNFYNANHGSSECVLRVSLAYRCVFNNISGSAPVVSCATIGNIIGCIFCNIKNNSKILFINTTPQSYICGNIFHASNGFYPRAIELYLDWVLYSHYMVLIRDNIFYRTSYCITANSGDPINLNIDNNAHYLTLSGFFLGATYQIVEITNTKLLASDPFIDIENNDLRLNNLPGGGALCRAAGIGPVGQLSHPDIGAVQTVPPETTPSGTLIYFTASDNNPPAANFARPTYRNGHLLLNFSDSSTEYAVFTGVMPSTYYNRGVSVIIYWAAATSTNTSHAVRWGAQFEALKAGGHDLDADDFAAAKYALGNPPSESGQVVKTQIDFGNGVDIDDVVAGDAFRLRIFRDGADSNDTMSGDAQLLAVEIVEGV